MTLLPVEPVVRSIPVTLSGAAWLSVTTVLALLALYVVGFAHGAVSMFGWNLYVHEFTHDARHLLGYPCH
ncbi:CbtB domain-containing protein [Mycobacterium simiae]|uniref:CbtB domain-containing protein n=1 Tax=Mycobacterium simiae TaxID=1784 RepID=UPI0003FEE9CD|nr:CbtB domain-containing protein [Mycobacterium simiae]PLV50941.1 cobalt transporter [Mycobacterium tuberculosis variant microti OV254]BBX43195.1 hypothetical protein MSIM_46460 [Mycobacterium simiae]